MPSTPAFLLPPVPPPAFLPVLPVFQKHCIEALCLHMVCSGYYFTPVCLMQKRMSVRRGVSRRNAGRMVPPVFSLKLLRPPPLFVACCYARARYRHDSQFHARHASPKRKMPRRCSAQKSSRVRCVKRHARPRACFTQCPRSIPRMP